jgi:phosphoenolpyruvate carboxylase
MKIPHVMSTQHPYNVQLPFFAGSLDMSGDNEINGMNAENFSGISFNLAGFMNDSNTKKLDRCLRRTVH